MAPGMKTHSDSSFNESKEVSILKLLLESKKSIKTFFGENEKTPNHDGFFELVNTDTRQPKKQFIVQIKKDDTLQLNKDGSRSFSFDTAFLFYVKEKVTENPAIAFVVELDTGKCFYKYLSDDYLMQLDFENQDHVTLRLYDQDQIVDIDTFYNELCKISSERNAKFINKSPEQIEEIKVAVEWLNKAMEDIPFLKELIPDFWRFGIASSNNLPIVISAVGKEPADLSNGHNANAFGLYLQCKNGLDYGIQEFVQQHYLKTTFDFTNTLTPFKYVQNVFVSLLEDYFNSYILNPKYLSDTVLSEIVFSMLDKMAFTENYVLSKPNTVRTYYKDEEDVETAKNNLLKFFSYFTHIVNNDIADEDVAKRQMFLKALRRTPLNNSGVDLIQTISTFAGNDFKSWNGKCYPFNILMNNIGLFTKEYFQFCVTIMELERRKIKNVKRIWNICNDDFKSSGVIKFTANGIDTSDYTPIKRTHGNSIYSWYDDNKLDLAIRKWISDLPNEYSYCYEQIFGRNSLFKYYTDARTKVIAHEDEGFMSYWLELRGIKFSSPQGTTICYDDTIPNKFNGALDEKIYSKKIISNSSGIFPIELFESRLPLYNGIKIFLWQGIVSHYNLDVPSNGVIVGHRKCSLF